MESGYSRITVCFEDPFWVCYYLRGGGGEHQVCRIVFGPEPSDRQVWSFLLEQWRRLPFGPAPETGPGKLERNPKRRQREIQKALQTPGPGTKAQQAWKLQQAQGKEARKRRTRQEREAEQQRRFALRREKRKEKHRGH